MTDRLDQGTTPNAEIQRLTPEQYDRLNAAVDHPLPRSTVGEVVVAIVNEYLASPPAERRGGAS